MKKILTILLLAISGLASAQTYQLNYDDVRIGKSNTSKIVLRGSNVQFPFLALGNTTDSVLTIAGGQIKKVPRSQFSGGGSSYTFDNGLVNVGGTVGLGGGASWDYSGGFITINNSTGGANLLLTPTGYNINFLNSGSGASVFGSLAQSNLQYSNGTNISGLTISSTGFNIFDNINSKGLYYSADYSVGRTLPTDNNWIPNAKWVNSQIAAIAPAYTFNNGLTNTAGTVSLGGNYTGNIFIGNGNNGSLSLDNSSFALVSRFGNINGDSTQTSLTWNNSSLSVSDLGLVYSSVANKGMFYDANYRNGITDKWIPDKKYVDSVAAASGGSSTPDTTVYRTVANSFTKAQTNTQISNALTGYVPNTRTITSGIGLNGGGDLSANRTLTVDTTTIRTVANSYTLAGLQTKLNNYLTTASATATYVPKTLTLTNGYGINSIGDLSSNRTISVDTTSVNALVSKSRLTASLQNFNVSSDFTGTGTVASPFSLATPISASKGGAGTNNGILKANGSGVVSTAVANSDYLPVSSPVMTGTPVAPTPGSNINTTQIPTTAWTNTYYAAKASPALTGTPTAPTAATATNTTQIATTAYVKANLAALTTPTLQQVTTSGATSTNNISVPSVTFPFNAVNASSRTWRSVSDINVFGDYSIEQTATQSLTGFVSRLYIAPSGNVLIGSTTDDGVNKLQVNGKASVSTAPTTATGVLRLTDLGTGWASYADNVYTSGSPFSITSGTTSTLPNNAAVVINNQLPLGVTSFYDSTNQKITPELNGDYYVTTIRFKAQTTAPTAGYFDFGIDIGGALGVQFKETKIFAKGAGIVHDFSIVVPMYVASTFIANGGIVKITSGNGTMTVYDINYQIERIHKAK